jgi:hypothetical protein
MQQRGGLGTALPVPLAQSFAAHGALGEWAFRSTVCLQGRRPLRIARGLQACRLLSAFADDLGESVVSQARTLLRWEGCGAVEASEHANPRPIVKFFLLVAARWSPKIQFLAACEQVTESGELCDDVVDSYPLHLRIARRSPLLPGNYDPGEQVVSILTGDELAHWSAERRATWRVAVANYELDVALRSLLHMRVTGDTGIFAETKALAPRPRRQARHFNLLDFLPLELVEDPFAGNSAASPLQALPPPSAGPSGASESGDLSFIPQVRSCPGACGDLLSLHRQSQGCGGGGRTSVD